MNYSTPLIEGQFLKRYKRFFADVEINGEKVVAHVPNTGSLKGICDKPRPCRASPSTNPERKLKFTLEQVKCENSWVGVNTHRANDIAWEAFTQKTLPHWHNFIDGVREAKINAQTRLDFKFSTNAGKTHFVEVKSVTLADGDVAKFPDAETTRGQKHLVELMDLLSTGATCEILFVVQRTDTHKFCAAKEIDPEYARLLSAAREAGVLISAFPVDLNRDSLVLRDKTLQVVWD